MIKKTLRLRILTLLLSILTIGMMLVYYIFSNELQKSINEYQNLYYGDKINIIIKQIDEKYQKLKKTGMVSAYEDSFKEGTISSIKKIYLKNGGTELFPFVIDENKIFIVHKEFNEKNTNLYKNNENFLKILKMKNGSFFLVNHEDKGWTIFKHYKEWDWIVGYTVPGEIKYRTLRDFRKNFFVIVLIILIIISIFIIMSVKYILNPIERLTVASKKIASGDLQSEIKINGSYELTELSNSFTIMRDTIRKNLEELGKSNELLEHKVNERTNELKKTINNLKDMQKQLVESEKIASLGMLVAGVAHEINTPLGIGITGITHFLNINEDLLKKYGTDTLSQEEFEEFIKTSHELATTINVNLVRAAELIRSFKKVAIDRESEEKRKFNVNDYLDEVLLSLQNITKKTKHKYIIDCPKGLSIDSYPGLFSQIITNLIMNSLIHAFKNKKAGEIHIAVKKEDSILSIMYTDNGCGISQENLKKVFDPFFTTNRKNGGSGLGLNIIYNIIVSQLKGTINLKSNLGEGVEFFVKIPL